MFIVFILVQNNCYLIICILYKRISCVVCLQAGGLVFCDSRDFFQNVVFSVFSAIFVIVFYYLSRSVSDFSVLWYVFQFVNYFFLYFRYLFILVCKYKFFLVCLNYFNILYCFYRMLIKDLIWEKDNSESSEEELVDFFLEKFKKCVVSQV